ncbi:mucin-13-like isoform X2 [Stegostoma tigrinum]|uniref:mucin-13-like isoform X1 n=1 Tax=Stegostoma tigrinum TaxID=3053191 RepID=UPI002870048D|nr:mucin-13-like isoform X1 [Stegostoma tigrinum]XP_059503345.1 mucin-13-like isoform X2 [Stegostoma tigrinum]
MFSLTSICSLRKTLLCGFLLLLLHNAVVSSAASDPGSSSTPVAGSSSTPVAGSSSTPVAGSSSTPVAGTNSTTPPAHRCIQNSCGDGATCVEIHQGYFCECNYNYYYEETNRTCVKGQSFGAELTLNMEFVQAMTNKTSIEYKELLDNVTSFFNESLFSIGGYKTTLILEVRKGSVITVVSNTFTENADVNETKIENAVKTDGFYSFKTMAACGSKKCDQDTTINCYQPLKGGLAECVCKAGFYKPNRYDTKCQDSCNTQCHRINEYTVREGDKCICKCQPGYKRRNNECESCPFGYGGIDCMDGFQVSTIVIGVLAGVVIISMTIGLIYACMRLKHTKHDEHRPLVKETEGENLTTIPRINLSRLATSDYDENSHQRKWNAYENPSMETDYNRRRYY